ncbi:MAG: hypothetical protein NZ929_06275 [Aigarchaeota archaeon]|nr:hypothetical protein [Aigarchaeota archaeon]MDW7986661.1 hypothetical protein [Nitrososphaerota archaeon]
MNREKLLGIVLATAFTSFTISYLIHHPKIEGNIYSDIVSFWYSPLVREVKIPYVDEGFAYPPISGFIVYLSALIGKGELIPYYNTFSMILYLFYLLLVITIFKIMNRKNIPILYLFIFLIFSPSMIVYLNYNFDIVFASLLMLSLILYEKGKYKLSALAFCATALAKLINLILLPLMLSYLKSWKSKVSYIVYSIFPFLGVNLVLQIINPNFLSDTYLFHAEWGLENAWFLYLFPSNESWDTAKLFSALIMVYGVFKIYLTNVGDIYERAFMLLSVFLLTNYVFTPQMVIWLLPFLAIMGRLPITFYILEVANVGIILTWFMVDNPLAPGALPQNLALIRAAALLYMLIETYLLSSKRYTISQEFKEFLEKFFKNIKVSLKQ